MDALDRDHQTPASINDESAFNAIQDSSANAYALAGLEKRIGRERDIVRQQRLNTLDLAIWDRDAAVLLPHKSQHAPNANDRGMHLGNKGGMNKGITGKQRRLNDLAAVAPPAHLREQGQICGNALFLEFSDNFLFMPRIRLHCIPVRLFHVRTWYHLASRKLIDAIHSSA